MIGLKFKIKNEYDTILNKLFHGINFSDYKWKIVDEEVLGMKGQEFFIKYEYDNNEFQAMIQKEHYPIFLNLQIFPRNSSIIDFKNYGQFLKSSCELVLFITDNIFVAIFVKDGELLEKIYKNVINYNYTNIEYIRDSKEMSRLLSLYSDQ